MGNLLWRPCLLEAAAQEVKERTVIAVARLSTVKRGARIGQFGHEHVASMEIAQQKGGVLTAAHGAADRRSQLVQNRGLQEKALRIGSLAVQHLVGEEVEYVVTCVRDADQKG